MGKTRFRIWSLLGLAGVMAFPLPAAAFSSIGLTVSNTLTSTPANYTVTGYVLTYAVAAGDAITVTLPTGSVVSGSLSINDITVNGVIPSGLSVSSTTLTITAPAALTVGTDLVVVIGNLRITNSNVPYPTQGVVTLVTTGGDSAGIGVYFYVPTPTSTPTFTKTPTFTATPSSTATPTRTFTPTATPSYTATPTRTITMTPTITKTATITPTFTTTMTRTVTISPTISPTITLTATPLSSITVTVTVTITPVLVKPGAIFSYPAPARGAEVWFYFNAPKPGRVEIELYNVAGEKITNLGEDLAQSGNGRLRWTLGSVAPGVYLYRVRFLDHGGQGDWSGIQKMAVVKNAGVH